MIEKNIKQIMKMQMEQLSFQQNQMLIDNALICDFI